MKNLKKIIRDLVIASVSKGDRYHCIRFRLDKIEITEQIKADCVEQVLSVYPEAAVLVKKLPNSIVGVYFIRGLKGLDLTQVIAAFERFRQMKGRTYLHLATPASKGILSFIEGTYGRIKRIPSAGLDEYLERTPQGSTEYIVSRRLVTTATVLCIKKDASEEWTIDLIPASDFLGPRQPIGNFISQSPILKVNT